MATEVTIKQSEITIRGNEVKSAVQALNNMLRAGDIGEAASQFKLAQSVWAKYEKLIEGRIND